MKKRKLSDIILDEIRRGRVKYLIKRRNKTNNSKTSSNYINDKQDRIIDTKKHRNLKKIPCPRVLCLDNNTNETIKFLNQIPGSNIPDNRTNRKLRRRLIKKSKSPKTIKSYFDFASVEEICPATALIISSSYFMYKKYENLGAINVFDWKKWNQNVKDTLRTVGFFELLEFNLIPTDENLHKIPIKGFRSGKRVTNAETTKYFQRLEHEVDEKFFKDKENGSFKKTASAISEAVENSVRHAYPRDMADQLDPIEFPEELRNRWWFGGIISPDIKKITLICHDKGISIPRHIKDAASEEDGYQMHSWIKARIDQFITNVGKTENDDNLDHKRLEFAMQYAKTSTGNEGGGKGLSHIVKTIEDFPNGKIRIMSRRAHAVITENKDPVFTLLDTPIIGTLIIWEIRL